MVQFTKQAKSNQEHLQTWQDRGLVSRLWNKEHGRSIKIPTSNAIQWLQQPIILSNTAIRYEKRTYMLLVAIQTLLYKISPNSTWAKRLKDLIEQYPSLSKANMGMPELWHQAPFWQHALQQNEE